MNINKIGKMVHQLAIEKGWWEEKRPIPELLCLMHSEISEALEAYRDWNNDLFWEEIADLLIRTFDMCAAFNVDIEKKILIKHNINQKRPYKHGNKKC